MANREEVERERNWQPDEVFGEIAIVVSATGRDDRDFIYPVPPGGYKSLYMNEPVLHKTGRDRALAHVAARLQLEWIRSRVGDGVDVRPVEVLVHSNGGIHRTPPLVVALLRRTLGCQPEIILNKILEARPQVREHWQEITLEQGNQFTSRTTDDSTWESMKWAFEIPPGPLPPPPSAGGWDGRLPRMS